MSDEDNNQPPTDIRVSKDRALMTLVYPDGYKAELTAEYLRIFSPSAEVTGHGPGQEITQDGKRHVLITDITPTGRYAIRIQFSDGHETGLYRWAYLRQLSEEYDTRWPAYLAELDSKNLSRG